MVTDIIVIAVFLWAMFGFYVFAKTEDKCHDPVFVRYSIMVMCCGPLIWIGMLMGASIDVIDKMPLFEGAIEKLSDWVNGAPKKEEVTDGTGESI